MHDFFVAAMIVALRLNFDFEFRETMRVKRGTSTEVTDQRLEMTAALETANEYWRMSREQSVEAAKAYGMFTHVLAKVKRTQRCEGETAVTGVSPLNDSFLPKGNTLNSGLESDQGPAIPEFEFDAVRNDFC